MSSITIITGGTIITIYHGAPGKNGADGNGDVVGPSLAVNNRIAVFDGTTGKQIKDGGVSVQGIYDLIDASIQSANTQIAQEAQDRADGDNALSSSISGLFEKQEITVESGSNSQMITIPTGAKRLIVQVEIQGSARGIQFQLATVDTMDAAEITVVVFPPSIAGFVIEFVDEADPFTLLDRTTTDASGRKFNVLFGGYGSEWKKDGAQYPIS